MERYLVLLSFSLSLYTFSVYRLYMSLPYILCCCYKWYLKKLTILIIAGVEVPLVLGVDPAVMPDSWVSPCNLFCRLRWLFCLVSHVVYTEYMFTSFFPSWMPFSPQVHWLDLLIHCWLEAVRLDILVLFLILGESILSSYRHISLGSFLFLLFFLLFI